MKTKFNSELSGMDPEIVKEMLRAMRAAKDSSPMTVTNMYRDVKGKTGIPGEHLLGFRVYISYCKSGSRESAESQDLASDSESDYSGSFRFSIDSSASIFIESEVLGDGRKEIECAIIQGTEGTKEVLISLRLMKNWE